MMKKGTMKAMLAPALLALAAVIATPAAAGGDKAADKGAPAAGQMAAEKGKTTGKTGGAARKAVESKARKKGVEKADLERQKILKEAVAALRETQNAIAALDKGDKAAALAALEKVVGKLEIVLARAPDLALAPVDVTTQTLDIYADVKSVRKAVDEAVRLLKKGRVQDARALVSGLASEIVIEVVNIPLATYPDAIKAVVPLIEQGKVKEAKAALVAALNTLVITRHIVPLPILRVEQMLQRAEVLAEKEKRSEAEQKELDGILKAARTELQFAEALGYGKEGDFKPFYEQLDRIAEKTKGGKYGKGFFDELKKALAEFRAKLF